MRFCSACHLHLHGRTVRGHGCSLQDRRPVVAGGMHRAPHQGTARSHQKLQIYRSMGHAGPTGAAALRDRPADHWHSVARDVSLFCAARSVRIGPSAWWSFGLRGAFPPCAVVPISLLGGAL